MVIESLLNPASESDVLTDKDVYQVGTGANTARENIEINGKDNVDKDNY